MKALPFIAVPVTLFGLLVSACDRADSPTEPAGPSALSLANGPEIEPNNVCSAPQNLGTVTLPFTIDGSLDGSPLPTGDVDFFRVAGTPNAAVRVDLEGQATGCLHPRRHQLL